MILEQKCTSRWNSFISEEVGVLECCMTGIGYVADVHTMSGSQQSFGD